MEWQGRLLRFPGVCCRAPSLIESSRPGTTKPSDPLSQAHSRKQIPRGFRAPRCRASRWLSWDFGCVLRQVLCVGCRSLSSVMADARFVVNHNDIAGDDTGIGDLINGGLLAKMRFGGGSARWKTDLPRGERVTRSSAQAAVLAEAFLRTVDTAAGVLGAQDTSLRIRSGQVPSGMSSLV